MLRWYASNYLLVSSRLSIKFPTETCLEKIADRECALECGGEGTVHSGEKETGCCSNKRDSSRAFSLPLVLISYS